MSNPLDGPCEDFDRREIPTTDPADVTDWCAVSTEPLRHYGSTWGVVISIRLFLPAESPLWVAFEAVAGPGVDVVAAIDGTLLAFPRSVNGRDGRRWALIEPVAGWVTVAVCVRGSGTVRERALCVTRRDPAEHRFAL